MSGSDIAVHAGGPEILVTEVRNWLSSKAPVAAPGPSRVWTASLEFMSENYDHLKSQEFSDKDIEALPTDELLRCITKWLSRNWSEQ